MLFRSSGWDKALYYFCAKDFRFNFVWFLEDDVFFNGEATLQNIDKQYPAADLLSNKTVKNKNGDKNIWHWNRIKIKFPPPYHQGMMCAIRVSKKLLNSMARYVYNHKTLFFLEAFVPTIAHKNKLNVKNPDEFLNIHYRREFKPENINKTDLFHPIKDLEMHQTFREQKDEQTE